MSATARRARPRLRTAPSEFQVLRIAIRHGLRADRRSPLVWGGALGAMSALYTILWPSISGSAATLVDSYPSGLKRAFGIQQLDSIEAFLDAELLSLIAPFALAFFAIRCVARPIVEAEEHHHLDTLLSLPVTRRVLVAAALAVTGLDVVAILALVWLCTCAAGLLIGAGLSPGVFALGLMNLWPLTMAFAGLATLLAGALHRSATVTAVSAGTLVVMYALDVAGKLAGGLEPLRDVSAFRLYGSAVQDGLDLSHVSVLIAVGLTLAAAGAWLFERRDVR